MTEGMKVIFKTNEFGAFSEVVNYKEIRDYIQKKGNSLRELFKDSPGMLSVLDQTIRMFSTKEAIESITIKDVLQFHMFHGVRYKLAEEVTETLKVPNLLKGPDFDAQCSVSLHDIYLKQDYFVMKSRQEVNKEQFKKAMFDFVNSMVAKTGGKAITEEELGELQNDRVTYSKIHNSGWVLSSTETFVVSVQNASTIEKRKIEMVNPPAPETKIVPDENIEQKSEAFADGFTASVNDLYKIEMPGVMSKASDLNDDATLQYQNFAKELYLIVIEETKEEFHTAIKINGLENEYSTDLNGYSAVLNSNFSVEDMKKSPMRDIRLNGMNAKLLEIEGKVNGYGIYYLMAIVEGKDHYFQVLAWTLLDRKSEHKPTLEKIVNSFRVVKN